MAAGSPELRLGVSFDLETFKKTALPALNQAASSFKLDLKIHFDRTSINEEMRLLGRQLGQRKYRIDLNDTSIQSAINKVNDLAKRLSTLKGTAGKAEALGGVLSGVKAPQTRAIYGSAKELGIVSGTVSRTKAELEKELKAGFITAGQEAVDGLIQGILGEKGKLGGIASSLGDELLTELKKSLDIASPSRKMMKIGQQAGQGFNDGLIAALQTSTRNAVAMVDESLKRLDRMVEMRQRKARAIAPSQPGFELAQQQSGIMAGQRERVQNKSEALQLRGAATAFETGSYQNLSKILQSLQIEASEIKPNTAEWNALQQKIAEVQIVLQRAAKQAEEIQMRAELGAFSPGSLRALESRLVILKSRARDIAPDTREWKELNREIQKSERLIEKASRKPLTRGQRVGAAGGAFLYGGGMGGGVGSAVGGVVGGLAGGVPGAFAGAAVGQAADTLGQSLAGLTTQAAQVQQLQRGLALASIDAKDFAQAQAAVAETSTKLFIPIEQVSKSFAQLRVNTKQYGLSVEETKRILQGTILAVSAVGGSAEDVDGAMRAVVQILSKGSVQAEELRGQLGERFPGAVVKFAQANKLSFEELQKGLEQGTIGIKEFVAFAEKNYEDYAEFSQKLATAPEFAGRRLQIALEQIGLSIGSIFTGAGADIQDTLTGTLNSITQFVKDNEQELKIIASGIASLVSLISAAGAKIAKVVGGDIAGAFRDVANAAITLRNLAGLGNIQSISVERQATSARINKTFQEIATIKAENKKRTGGLPTPELAAAETTLKSLQKRRDELDQKFRGLGGNAAYQQVNQPAADLTFGGPGAGMSLERAGKGAGAEKKAKEDSLEGFERLRDQLANAYNQAEIERIKQRYELEKRLRDDLLDSQEFGANRLQRQNLSFLRSLIKAEDERKEAMMSAQLAVAQEAGKVDQLSQTIRAGSETGAYLQGNIGPTSTGPHFDVKKMGGGYFPREYLDKYVQVNGKPLSTGTTVPGGTFAGHQRRGSHGWDYAFGGGRHAATLMGGAKWMGGSPTAHGEARKFQLPTGEMFQFLHGKSEGITPGAPRKVGSNESRDTLAAAKTQIAQNTAIFAEQDSAALKSSALLKELARYQQEAFGLPDLTLDNRLLQERNNLMEQGVDENVINYKMRLFELDLQHKDLLAQLPKAMEAAGYATEQRAEAEAVLKDVFKKATEAEKIKNDETLRGIEIEERRQKQKQYDTEVEALRTEIGTTGAGLRAGFIGAAGSAFEGQLQEGRTAEQALEMAQLTEQLTIVQTRTQAVEGAINSVSDAFANVLTEGVMGLVEGTTTAEEVFKGFLKSIGQALMQAAQQMIAQYIAIGVARIFAGMKGGGAAPGGGGFGTAGASGPFEGVADSLIASPFANGGIAPRGFKAFADGGVVNGPTLGLVGEGKYNEAIIPLPDGRNVPVKMQGEQSSRELLSSMAAQQKPPSLNLSFQTTTIGGVEYVSRDQLEEAMSETRRVAARDGASRGASMAIDRIANNPSDRRRAGIR